MTVAFYAGALLPCITVAAMVGLALDEWLGRIA